MGNTQTQAIAREEEVLLPLIEGLEQVHDDWAWEIGYIECRVRSQLYVLDEDHLVADLTAYFGNRRRVVLDWDEDWRSALS